MRAAPVLLPLSVAAVWIFWGSTYAGMRLAGETIPPLVMASVRFLIAGGVLWIAADLTGRARARREDWRAAFVGGAMLLMIGNATTAWALQYLPTGITALLLSLTPVWMALFDFMLYRGRLTWTAGLGMVLGLGGVAMLIAPSLLDRGAIGAMPVLWVALAILSNVSWSLGSMLQRRLEGARSLIRSTAMQMLAGGVLIAGESILFGQVGLVRWSEISPASIGGLAWLIVFGSLVGYLAFLYVIRHAPTALASTYAYVNPLIAIILGMLLFGERLTAAEVVAGATILVGVALMMLPNRGAALAAEAPAPE
ncbi:MAG TPA: EamA family transporter [Candidatus Dormibacteraeota bacterium]|nr:EamA family transporter [Candidatus Dormibacteraeota bacterium]